MAAAENRTRQPECLKTDQRRIEAPLWQRWMDHVSKSRRGFAELIDFDPLTNETASMSVLAAAASRSGLFAMTDYVCDKHQKDRRKRLRRGRADLWVGSSTCTWAFEAKQIRCRPGVRLTTLEARLELARHDAGELPESEGDRFFGILVATLPDGVSTPKLEDCLTDFAQKADFAWRIGGGTRPAYVYLKAD